MRIALCLLFLGSPVLSRSVETSGDLFTTPQAVLSYMKNNHPHVKQWDAQTLTVPGLERVARQRVNPELETEYISQTSGGSGYAGETAFFHTWESGGKIDARLSMAQAQGRWIQAQKTLAQEQAILQTIRGLTRLRHIDEELRVVDETIHTFDTILSHYHGRSRLTPEQTVSLSIFELAMKGQKLERSRLLWERQEWTTFFYLSLGQDIGDRRDLLVPLFSPWPAPPQKATNPGGAQRLVQESEQALARARVKSADVVPWPDVALGPKLVFDKSEGQNTTGLGANISLALPLYQRNMGGRALAQAQSQVAALDFDRAQREWLAQDEALRKFYQDTVQLLSEMPSTEEIEQKHDQLENLFARGLIESSLVIEDHRQRSEWTEHRNAAEMRATEALWNLRALNNVVSEVAP
jgi:cobalt-zinc-cadmium efflux system outer membrane protein